MEKENTEELFSIRLNDEGIKHLLKFAGLVKGYLLTGIIFTLFALIDTAILTITRRDDYGDSFMNVYFSISPFLSLVGIILFIVQLVYYRRIGNTVQKAIMHTDEIKFNSVLIYFVRGMNIAIAGTILSLFFTIADIIVSLKFRF